MFQLNIYIWERVDKVSDRYHEAGGVIVIANDSDRARELAKDNGVVLTQDKKDKNPDHAMKIEAINEQIIVFPDAGCC